jgi:hypothetical protein
MSTPDDNNLKGIGGWLILVAIGLCLQPLLLLRTLSQNIRVFTSDTWRILTTPGEPAYHPLWGPLLLAEAAVNVVLLAVSVALLFQFFRRRRGFPRMAVAYMAASLAVVLADFAATSAIPTARAQMTAKDAADIGRSALSAAVWIPYFLKSRRVAATFVN